MAANYNCGVLLRQNGPVGCVLATCRGQLSAAITRLMSKCLWSGWKWLTGVIETASHFPCCPVNRECLGKKTQTEKKCTLGESRHRGFLGFLVVDNICYIFLTVRQAAFGEEGRWRQIKSIYRWHLDLVTESFRCINSLNAWAPNCATFWNQKLYCDTVFLHKNDEMKNSSGLQFKA